MGPVPRTTASSPGRTGVRSCPLITVARFSARAGTKFTLRLPRPHTISPEDAGPDADSTDAFRTVRVLLVDDDPLVLETYEEGLSLQGHEVVVALGGNDALLALSKESLDVMITDLSMSGMSGLELARRVKKIVPRLPIILLSGWAIQQDEKQVRQAGVDYVVAKPCTIDRLVDTIQEATRVSVRSPDG